MMKPGPDNMAANFPDGDSSSTQVPTIAHKHDAKTRTHDIHLDEDVSFSDLGLGPHLVDGLSRSGFEKPSPIQLSAIPCGRCGLDLVVQAKSGTGKTCVFTIIALESVDVSVKSPQVLILAPTREIALQIQEVIGSIGSAISGLKTHCSIGGLSLKDDQAMVRKAHIIIGTPGRVKQLMELSALNTSSVRLFVLDEADKLMEESFQEQINWIYSGLPESKQVIAASATYTEELVKHLCNYMCNPTFIRLNSNDPVLLGVRQYRRRVETGSLPNQNYENKVTCLMKILSQCNFQQCLIFSNLMSRAENLSRLMIARGWPTTHIAGSQDQADRIKAITRLKTYDCRILISTDLTSRGIDADRIDLVINLDLPFDSETYLHRVGRAGRFGANGAAITLYTDSEAKKLEEIAEKVGTTVHDLPDELDPEFIHKPQELPDEKKLVQVESFQIITDQSKAKGEAQSTSADTAVDASPSRRTADNEINGGDATKSLTDISVGDSEGATSSRPITSSSGAQVSGEQIDGVDIDDKIIILENGASNVTAGESDTSKISEASIDIDSSVDSTDISNTDEKNYMKQEVAESVIASHRPPFQSLRDAMNFALDPTKYGDLLATTTYTEKEVIKKTAVAETSKQQGKINHQSPAKVSHHTRKLTATKKLDKSQDGQVMTTKPLSSSPVANLPVQENKVTSTSNKSSHISARQSNSELKDLPSRRANGELVPSQGSSKQANGDRTLSQGASSQTKNPTTRSVRTQTDEEYNYYNGGYSADGNEDYSAEWQLYYEQQYAAGKLNQDGYWEGSNSQNKERADNSYQPDYYQQDNDYGMESHHCENTYSYAGYPQGYTESGCGRCGLPQDRLKQTLDIHYRQVYLQQSYIMSMARK